MPLIHIELFEGRSQEQKKALAAALTRETARVLACPETVVDIIFTDIRKQDWASAGVMWSDKA